MRLLYELPLPLQPAVYAQLRSIVQQRSCLDTRVLRWVLQAKVGHRLARGKADSVRGFPKDLSILGCSRTYTSDTSSVAGQLTECTSTGLATSAMRPVAGCRPRSAAVRHPRPCRACLTRAGARPRLQPAVCTFGLNQGCRGTVVARVSEGEGSSEQAAGTPPTAAETGSPAEATETAGEHGKRTAVGDAAIQYDPVSGEWQPAPEIDHATVLLDGADSDSQRASSSAGASSSGSEQAATETAFRLAKQGWTTVAAAWARLLSSLTSLVAWIPMVARQLKLKRLRAELQQHPNDPARQGTVLWVMLRVTWERPTSCDRCTWTQRG